MEEPGPLVACPGRSTREDLGAGASSGSVPGCAHTSSAMNSPTGVPDTTATSVPSMRRSSSCACSLGRASSSLAAPPTARSTTVAIDRPRARPRALRHRALDQRVGGRGLGVVGGQHGAARLDGERLGRVAPDDVERHRVRAAGGGHRVAHGHAGHGPQPGTRARGARVLRSSDAQRVRRDVAALRRRRPRRRPTPGSPAAAPCPTAPVRNRSIGGSCSSTSTTAESSAPRARRAGCGASCAATPSPSGRRTDTSSRCGPGRPSGRAAGAIDSPGRRARPAAGLAGGDERELGRLGRLGVRPVGHARVQRRAGRPVDEPAVVRAGRGSRARRSPRRRPAPVSTPTG